MLAWLTKSALPNSLAEYVITLPTDELWQADFFGAIAPLVDAINWEQHEALTPDEMADKWAEILLPQFWGLKMALPIGTIIIWPTNTPPDGYLICNGNGYSEVDYPELFSVIGHTYGNPVQGVFQVPDCRGRFPLGVSTGHGLATTGGSETHTLAVSEMPSHSHSYYHQTGGALLQHGTLGTSTALFIASGMIGNTGGGGSHNNMPPYLSMFMAIKAF